MKLIHSNLFLQRTYTQKASFYFQTFCSKPFPFCCETIRIHDKLYNLHFHNQNQILDLSPKIRHENHEVDPFKLVFVDNIYPKVSFYFQTFCSKPFLFCCETIRIHDRIYNLHFHKYKSKARKSWNWPIQACFLDNIYPKTSFYFQTFCSKPFLFCCETIKIHDKLYNHKYELRLSNTSKSSEKNKIYETQHEEQLISRWKMSFEWQKKQ